MSDLFFLPSDDVAILLNALLNAYERRRLPSPKLGEGSGPVLGKVEGAKGIRTIKIALGDTKIRNYFSQIDPHPRLIANEQLKTLEQKGWLRLIWQPGETGHLLKEIAMTPDCAPRIFNLLGRTPLTEKRTRLVNMILGERFRFQGGWRQRAIRHILAQLKAGKSPTPFSLSDQQFNEDLLIALASLDMIKMETPYRVFSVRLFNNSKRFEELKGALANLARRGQPEWRELSVQEVLGELNLVPNPDYLYLSGPWQLVGDLGQMISLEEFSPSVGISTAQAARLQRVTVRTSQVICVENPTSFHELIRNTEYGTLVTLASSTGVQSPKYDPKISRSSIATLCLWGNPSPACRHLLSCLADNLPESIPLRVWADLDYGGFNILALLRRHVSRRFKPYLMDVETLETHALWARPLTQHDERNLKRLANHPALMDVKPVIMHMLQRNLKLEQEAIRAHYSQ
jgi:hypothetical protein